MPYRPLRAYGGMKIYLKIYLKICLKICLKKKRTLFRNMPCSIVRGGKLAILGI